MPEQTCAAARCHRPVTDARLCTGCTDLLREQLGKLAGSPAAARVRDDQPGPWRDQHGIRPAPDRGLLADVELTATRQDVAAPDTTRPAEQVEDGGRRTKDRPELAPAVTTLPFRPGASQVLADARRDLCQLVCDVLERRYGAYLGLDGRAVMRGERLYRSKTAPPRQPGPLGPAHGPWSAAIRPGKYPAEHAAWLALGHAWDIAQLEYAGHAADDLARLVDRAENVIVRVERVYLGWCGRCYDREDGSSAIVDVYADRDATDAACPRCNQRFDVASRRRDMLDAAADHWASAPDVSRALVDWVRDVRSRDRDGTVVDDHPDELTVKAIEGMAARGRISYRARTRAEEAAAKAAGRRPPATRYRIGEVMSAVVTMHAEKLAAQERRRKGIRRAAPTGQAPGARRAAG